MAMGSAALSFSTLILIDVDRRRLAKVFCVGAMLAAAVVAISLS